MLFAEQDWSPGRQKGEENMDINRIMESILDSIPYPIVFVDCEHIIRYLNREAKHRYYQERGHNDLIGKSIFECHNEKSKLIIEKIFKEFVNHGEEAFLRLNVRNERIYMTPIRDEKGNLIGYFERFERNFVKS